MTPEERRRSSEADTVEQVYQWALTQVGVSAIADAFAIWTEHPPIGGAAAKAAWLAAIKAALKVRAEWATELALPYYRLTRALRTGATIEADGLKNEDVSLDDLREEFSRVVAEVRREPGLDAEALAAQAPSQKAAPPSQAARTAPSGAVQAEGDVPVADDEDGAQKAAEPDLVEEVANFPVEVESLERDVDDIIDDIFDRLESQIDDAMIRVGADGYEAKVTSIDTSLPASEVDEKRSEAAKAVRAQQMAEAERIAMLAARGLTYDLSSIDARCLGWVRYSKTGTPCGWCAMLISRGFVEKNSSFYRSRATAGDAASSDPVGEEFHRNCHCVAVPIYFKEQLATSPLFELNRQYGEEWPVVTKGLGGKSAEAAWRRYIRQQQKQPAQVAA